jgi:hypothetical protein
MHAIVLILLPVDVASFGSVYGLYRPPVIACMSTPFRQLLNDANAEQSLSLHCADIGTDMPSASPLVHTTRDASRTHQPLHVEAWTSMPRALPDAVASPLFRISWRVSGRHRCRCRARRRTRLHRRHVRCSLVSCMPRRWGIRPTQPARVTWIRDAKIFQAQLAARNQLAVCHPQPKPRPAPGDRKCLFRIGMQACAM